MQIPEIKQRLPLSNVLTHYGLVPDRNYRQLCPFHADKNTKSLQLYPKTNSFYCFGCRKTGDVIDFIMLIEDLTKYEAIQCAERIMNNEKLEMRSEAESRILSGNNKPLHMEATVNKNYADVFKALRENIFHYPQAQNYCNNRKINYNKHEIGYNPGKTFDKLKYCIVFPLKDKNGTITGLYGRSTINNDNAKHFCTPNRRGLYPGWPEETTQVLILTEAIVDTTALQLIISSEQTKNNDLSVLSLFGTNGLTLEHKAAITNLPHLKEIILFLDGDKAGREAVTEHAKTLYNFCPNVTIKNVLTPDNEDINSLYIKHGSNCLVQLINEAVSLTPHDINHMASVQLRS